MKTHITKSLEVGGTVLMKEKGILFILSGPSGVGKGTVRERLFEQDRSLKYSISATTRDPRPGEVDGEDYFFKSREEFELMIAENKLFEHAKYVNNYYGTPKDYVEEQIAMGNDVFLEIEVQGAMQVKEDYAEGVFIFLAPPSINELKNRILGRGTESVETVDNRLQAAKEEIRMMRAYDYVVVNDDIDIAVENIQAIVTSENCKRERLEAHYLKILEDD